ncbi:TraR/DksA C4-type zinc finger protein [Aquibacillus koreensis]|uniref:TraR/DksA C4-type zinc finger protein n=1 Tax=Aquibacillus koreensis TaxID=279446 RepID=A0A9X4AL76_9BACI|nr:TraR/DksA C4-type zinc finger protein [Aquibacillus koreensis]MCT2534923.1 TraR/DksA C4-type zinc finger protein [Aquibacillus koreensis]MDC3422183.1 TraR/DksA C4-type zinc finger protein [Aquibacillus koreensis]
MISNEQLHACKQVLEQEKQEVMSHLQDHYGLEQELIKESVGELSNYDNHPGDHGTELYEREKDIALNEHAEQELKDINRALQAIEQGSYGTCEVCGKEIPSERLEAMPTTQRCIEHAPKNVAVTRPVEEDVIHSSVNEMESSVDEEESTVFDAEDAWQHVEVYGSSDGPSDFYDTEKDYQDMYFNSGELVGSAEEIEGFLLTDMEGNYIGVNGNHEDYEAYLDENHVGSILYE